MLLLRYGTPYQNALDNGQISHNLNHLFYYGTEKFASANDANIWEFHSEVATNL